MGWKHLTPNLSYCIFAAALGMFNFGYNTGVINAPAEHIKEFLVKTSPRAAKRIELWWSVAVAVFAVGGMMGGFFGGFIANRYGRKGGMFINNGLAAFAGLLMFLTESVGIYTIFVIGRFIIGISCGLSTCLCPLYIAEIAPVPIRGALGTVNQLSVTLGILISQVLGLEEVLGSKTMWPYLMGATIIPVILQACLLIFSPETPPFLIKRGDVEGATHAMIKLRKKTDVSDEIEQLKGQLESSSADSSLKIHNLFKRKSLRMPIIIAIVMHCSQQLSGINGIFYYSTSLFLQTGIDDQTAKLINIGVGATMVLMTVVTIPLMDTTGRKTLHLIGLGGMIVSTLFITGGLVCKNLHSSMNIMAVAFTLVFVVFFALGPGSIPWLITAELFTSGPRPAAMGVATLVNWFTNCIIGLTFPHLNNCLTDFTFVPFSVLLIFFFIFTLVFLPETKNKTVEEVADYFANKANDRG